MMRLATIVELLLILLLVAFAAYGRVIENNGAEQRAISGSTGSKQGNVGISTLSLKQATDNVNRYCTCNENICNCCRDFHIPLVQLQGPGCASLQYMKEDNLAVQLSFGDNILTSTIVNECPRGIPEELSDFHPTVERALSRKSWIIVIHRTYGKNPKPVCVPLPGGFTKFCGRIYSIQRDETDHFKACLGLELQSATELEASLRVSCFRFGPEGLKLRPSEPLPIVEAEVSEEEDDDDDFFGFGSDEDDDDDDDNNETSPLANSVPNSSAEEDSEDDEDEDVLGFGALLDIITGGDESSTKKPKTTTPAPLLQFTIPILSKPTSLSPIETHDTVTAGNSVVGEDSEEQYSSISEEEDTTEQDIEDVTANVIEEIATEASNKVATYIKANKTPTKKVTTSEAGKKKPTLTSVSVNAIENNTDKKKKPLRKPVKDDDDDDDDILGGDLDDDDDDDEEDGLLDDDDDDEDDDDEKDSEEDDEDDKEHDNQEDEDEKAEEVEALDDDDDEEDAVISALVYDDKENGKKGKKGKKDQQTSDSEDDDSDYGLGLTGLLARSRHSKSARQSKVMRF